VPERSGADTRRAFAARVRAPRSAPLPDGVDARRMQVYEELCYSNVEGLLAGAFPVMRSVLGDAEWHALVRGFFADHRATSPFFTEVALELVAYLGRRQAHGGDVRRPFLLELAHYEWVELALSTSDADDRLPPLDPTGDPWTGVPVVSPLAWALSYRFPVHRIGPDHQPSRPEPSPTHLLVYRNQQDEVRFVETNAVTHRLLGLLHANPAWSGGAAVRQVAAELAGGPTPAVLAAGRAVLEDLRGRDVVLGTRP
jgi:hypothetical protein